MNKKDYILGISAGLLIGILALPVLKVVKPAIYGKFALFIVPFFLVGTPLGLIVANYISRKITVIWQVAKFVVIGALNTLVDWGILAILIFSFRRYLVINSTDLLVAGITFYSLYKAISFIIANINSYYWNKYWTFTTGVVQKTKTEFLQFFAVSLVGFAINVGIASYVFKYIQPFNGFNHDQWGIIGAAVGTIVGLFWNFVGYKFIVFKNANTA
jgi:putative flippase GtrA